MQRFKMTVSMVAIASILLLSVASFVRAEGTDPQVPDETDVTAEKILADVFVLRPIGLVATVFGIATYIVALPITLITKSDETVGKKLVGAPWKYTFQRRVGDLK
jgi:hypothetical protein